MSVHNGKAKTNGNGRKPFRPQAPGWAVAAGIPEPEEGESFRDYVTRLGLNPEPLLRGLDERTMVLANIRLSSKLADENPDVWAKHLNHWISDVRHATTWVGTDVDSTL